MKATVQKIWVLPVAILLLLPGCTCQAQDSDTAPTTDPGASPGAGDDQPDMRQLYRGWFTPQPQYPTPGVTLMNSDAMPANADEPLKHLFTPQPQYPTPGVTLMNQEPPSGQGSNPLRGIFQAQPQYPTPGVTHMNPESTPGLFQKEDDPLAREHTLNGDANAKDLPLEYKYSNPQDRASQPPSNPIFGADQHPKIGDHVFTPQSHPQPVPHYLDGDAAPAAGVGDPFWKNLPPRQPKPKPEAPVPAKTLPPGKSKVLDKAKDKAGKNPSKKKSLPDKAASLAPPPPPSAVTNSPLQEAVSLLKAKNYSRSLQVLSPVLQESPANPQAHYLQAVALVLMRRYAEAAAQYRQVQALAPDTPLAQRAAQGLKKIGLSDAD